MPYYRRRYAKKRYYKRKTYRRRTYKRTSGIKPEFKYIDLPQPITMNHDSASGAISCLSGAIRGTDINQRIGRKLVIKSIQIKGVTFNGANGVDQMCRCALVYDKTPAGATPAITDIWETTSPNSLRNLDFRSRFTIMWDHQFVLNAKTDAGNTRTLKYFKRVNLPVIYNGLDAGSIGDIEKGALWLITEGNVTGAGIYGTSVMYCRVRFIDA